MYIYHKKCCIVLYCIEMTIIILFIYWKYRLEAFPPPSPHLGVDFKQKCAYMETTHK